MTAIPLDQPPLPCTTRDGRKDFDLIIETQAKRDLANVRHAAKRCNVLCKGRDGTRNQPAIAPCPIQAECWAQAAENREHWVKLLEVVPKKDATCWQCGKGMDVGPLQSAKKFCGPDCYNAARREATRGPDGIIHGSDTGYSQHNKRGEAACEPCKEAHRIMQRVRAARRKAAA